MIDLYYAATPNGWKARIMLEELGLPYEIHMIDTTKSENLTDAYQAISASNKIPTIVDPDGPGGAPMTVFESGAIMRYLAEKTGSDLWPAAAADRLTVDQWQMFGEANFGPVLTQTARFCTREPGKAPWAAEFYLMQGNELYRRIDQHLADHEYFGPAYSVADISHVTWVARAHVQTIDLDPYPNVRRWFDLVANRPAVQRGMAE